MHHRRGPARPGRAPAGTAHPGADPLREAELIALVDALRDPSARRDGVSHGELRQRVGADAWPAGRFAPAVRHALATGLLLEVTPGRYALADPHP